MKKCILLCLFAPLLFIACSDDDYVYPNVFMSNEDTEQVSNLQADLQTYMNTQKANWIMNGTKDAEWNEYLSKLEAYGLSDYLGIMQKYLDAYYA